MSTIRIAAAGPARLAGAATPRYEYVVAGAGIVGTTLALRLAEAGHKVLLVEKSLRGNAQNATRASAGICHYYLPGQPGEMELALESMAFYGDLGKRVRGLLHPRPVLFCGTTVHPGALTRIGQAGRRVDLLDGRQAAARYRALHFSDGESVVCQPDAFLVNTQLAVAAVCNAFVKAGGTVTGDRQVTHVLREGGACAGVVLDGREAIRADRVVLATGAWFRETHPAHRVKKIVLPSFRVDGLRLKELFIDDPNDAFFWKGRSDGQLYVGHTCTQYLDTPEAFSGEITGDDYRLSRERARRRLRNPDRYAWSNLHGYIGFDGYRDDRNICFGTFGDVDGVFAVAGLNGRGFKIAPALAGTACRWLTTGDLDAIWKPFAKTIQFHETTASACGPETADCGR